MTNEREGRVTRDEWADSLSGVTAEFEDCEEIEDIASSEKQTEAESSDDPEIRTRGIRRTLPLLSNTEESDKDYSVQWSNFDLRRTSNNRRRQTKWSESVLMDPNKKIPIRRADAIVLIKKRIIKSSKILLQITEM